MTRLRACMSKINELLHLKFCHLPNRWLSAFLNIRSQGYQLTRPLPEDMRE